MNTQIDSRISESLIRVRYAETDAMGIVHHSAYIPWFEVGRSDWMREAGLPYSAFQEMGYYLTVVEIGARYLRPCFYDELVTVRTQIGEVKSRSIRIDYEVINANGVTLVTGFTQHVCITHDGRPTRLPEILERLLNGGE
ncbi:MAG: acyl-CoA thioesterase [Caldilineales bacterium]|nr:acyl-CoA thioesterase [Caldilineales bacterium]